MKNVLLVIFYIEFSIKFSTRQERRTFQRMDDSNIENWFCIVSKIILLIKSWLLKYK